MLGCDVIWGLSPKFGLWGSLLEARAEGRGRSRIGVTAKVSEEQRAGQQEYEA